MKQLRKIGFALWGLSLGLLLAEPLAPIVNISLTHSRLARLSIAYVVMFAAFCSLAAAHWIRDYREETP